MPRSLNVVIIASELPYPPTAGNRIRALNLALRLAARHSITFIAHRNRRVGRSSAVPARTRHRDGPRRPGDPREVRAAASMHGSRPTWSLPFLIPSPLIVTGTLRRAVRSHARSHRVDVWQVEAIVLLDALADLEGHSRVIIAQNVESHDLAALPQKPSNRF